MNVKYSYYEVTNKNMKPKVKEPMISNKLLLNLPFVFASLRHGEMQKLFPISTVFSCFGLYVELSLSQWGLESQPQATVQAKG